MPHFSALCRQTQHSSVCSEQAQEEVFPIWVFQGERDGLNSAWSMLICVTACPLGLSWGKAFHTAVRVLLHVSALVTSVRNASVLFHRPSITRGVCSNIFMFVQSFSWLLFLFGCVCLFLSVLIYKSLRVVSGLKRGLGKGDGPSLGRSCFLPSKF